MIKKFSLFGIVLIILLTLFTLFLQAPQVEAEKLVTPAAQQEPNQIMLEELKAQRSSSQNTDEQKNLEDKIYALEYKLSVQATAQAQPKKSMAEICASRVQLDIQPKEIVLGILDVREDFLNPQGFEIQNMWRGVYQGVSAEVYSGSLLENKDQGIVILSIPDLNIYQAVYDLQSDGSLKIGHIDGVRLHLTTANDGARFFDISARQFTEDALTVLPAADLPPLPTPIYDPCAQFDVP